MTKAEQILWEHIKKKQLKGSKFRRQHPIWEFVADFYCHTAKLIIEVDGGVHSTKEQKYYDQERTKELNNFGIRVLRFTFRFLKFTFKPFKVSSVVCSRIYEFWCFKSWKKAKILRNG